MSLCVHGNIRSHCMTCSRPAKKTQEMLDYSLYFDPITEEWSAVVHPCKCADPENCAIPVPGCRKPLIEDKRG